MTERQTAAAWIEALAHYRGCPDAEIPTPRDLAGDIGKPYMDDACCQLIERLAAITNVTDDYRAFADSAALFLLQTAIYGTPVKGWTIAAPEAFEWVHRRWEAWSKDREDLDETHPLGPLVEAWLRRPRPAARNTRPDRILPSKLGLVGATDRRGGKLFTPAVTADSQTMMPGWETGDPLSPALPLALYDLGVAADAPGRGAPLALRLFVESILSVPQKERSADHPISMEMTLRELLAALYPNRRPSPAEYWDRLERAVAALDSPDARILWQNPETGSWQLRRVVSVTGIPRGPNALDDTVRIVLDLPSGFENGPIVTSQLAKWGVRSAPAYRALLNLAYRWHVPSVTRYPVAGGRHWVQAEKPDRYDPVSDRELVKLMFPTSTNQTHRILLDRAKKVLTSLADAGEVRVIKDGQTRRILPPPYSGEGRRKVIRRPSEGDTLMPVAKAKTPLTDPDLDQREGGRRRGRAEAAAPPPDCSPPTGATCVALSSGHMAGSGFAPP